MVYSGRPSTGCLTCRKRRIKCGEEKPVCVQCTRSKRKCLGYPDPSDLLFHHQTSATIQRVRRETNARSRQHKTLVLLSSSQSSLDSDEEKPSETGDGYSYSPGSTNHSSYTQAPETLGFVLNTVPSQPIELAAVNFYLEGMILDGLGSGHVVGHLEMLPKMYLQASADSVLSHATKTVALAAFSKVGPGQEQVAILARQAYGKTVGSLQKALSCPVRRSSNETLLATLVMVVVESLLAAKSAPDKQWHSHIMGALWLIKMRGASVFEDPIAVRLMLVVRQFLQSSPLTIEQLDFLLGKPPPIPSTLAASPEYCLSTISCQLIAIRPRMLLLLQTAKSLQDFETLAQLADMCKSIDQDLQQWASEIPESRHYERSAQKKDNSSRAVTDDIFTPQLHLYPDPHTQRMWNSYRCARLFLNALMYSYESKSHLHQHQKHSTTSTISSQHLQVLQLLVDEICGSLPRQIANTTSIPLAKSYHPLATTATQKSTQQFLNPIQEGVAAVYMFWPLYVARSVPTLSLAQRNWIRTCMVEVANKYHVDFGYKVAERGDEFPERPLFMQSWSDECIENVWEYSFIYGCGGI